MRDKNKVLKQKSGRDSGDGKNKLVKEIEEEENMIKKNPSTVLVQKKSVFTSLLFVGWEIFAQLPIHVYH